MGELFSPLIPKFNFNFKNKKHHEEKNHRVEKEHTINKLGIIEDTWKLYTIHKNNEYKQEQQSKKLMLLIKA